MVFILVREKQEARTWAMMRIYVYYTGLYNNFVMNARINGVDFNLTSIWEKFKNVNVCHQS